MKCTQCDDFAVKVIAATREYHRAEHELADATFATKDAPVLEEISGRVSSLMDKRNALLEAFTTHVEIEHAPSRLRDRFGWNTSPTKS
jgi:hypothetical protein